MIAFAGSHQLSAQHRPLEAAASAAGVVMRYGQSEVAAELRFSCHLALIYVHRGSSSLEINEQTYTVSQGQLICFLGLHPHRICAASADNLALEAELPHRLILELREDNALREKLHSGHPFIATLEEPLSESRMHQWLGDLQEHDQRAHSLLIDEIAVLLRRLILRQPLRARPCRKDHAPAQRSLRHAQAMIRYMSENHHQRIRIADVASAANLDKNYAMKIFKQAMGMSILEYLTVMRINHARTLLQYSDSSIIQIAYDSGFSSLSRFYEVFAEAFGEPPMKFRRRFHQTGTENA